MSDKIRTKETNSATTINTKIYIEDFLTINSELCYTIYYFYYSSVAENSFLHERNGLYRFPIYIDHRVY